MIPIELQSVVSTECDSKLCSFIHSFTNTPFVDLALDLYPLDMAFSYYMLGAIQQKGTGYLETICKQEHLKNPRAQKNTRSILSRSAFSKPWNVNVCIPNREASYVEVEFYLEQLLDKYGSNSFGLICISQAIDDMPSLLIDDLLKDGGVLITTPEIKQTFLFHHDPNYEFDYDAIDILPDAGYTILQKSGVAFDFQEILSRAGNYRILRKRSGIVNSDGQAT